MSKMTKNQRINQMADQLARQQGVISKLIIMVKEQNEAILMLEKLTDEKLRDQPKPQLKQLDQSVFNGLDEKWRFAAVDKCGEAYVYVSEPKARAAYFVGGNGPDYFLFGQGYDASNWQNSLIERDTAKEPAEVDLSGELTGSELCKAMLARGDKYVMCLTSCVSDDNAIWRGCVETVISEAASTRWNFETVDDLVIYAVPINNQGEPLTASEVGL